MSKKNKLIQKIMQGRDVSYEEAEHLLLKLDFDIDIRGSHHIFRKKGYPNNISLKQRTQLLPYQLNDLKEVLRNHGY